MDMLIDCFVQLFCAAAVSPWQQQQHLMRQHSRHLVVTGATLLGTFMLAEKGLQCIQMAWAAVLVVVVRQLVF